MKAIGKILPEGGVDLARLEIDTGEAEAIAELIRSATRTVRVRLGYEFDPRSPQDMDLKREAQDQLDDYDVAAAIVKAMRLRGVKGTLTGHLAEQTYDAFMWSVGIHGDIAADKALWGGVQAKTAKVDELLGLIEYSMANVHDPSLSREQGA